MNPAQTVRALWDRIQARDWAGLTGLLDENLVVEWPASRERIVGPLNFVAVQSEYPDGWTINVLRILAEGDVVVSETEVPHQGIGVFRVVSIWTVVDGRVTHGREYWTELGADQRPSWREHLTELDVIDPGQ